MREDAEGQQQVDGQEAQVPAEAAAAGTGETGPPAHTLSHEDLNKRLERAGNSAVTKLLSALEIKSPDELTELVKAHRKAEEARMTKEERQAAEMKSLTLRAEQAEAALAGATRQSSFILAAVAAGIAPNMIEDAWKLADWPDNATAEEVVTALVSDRPWLTGGAAQPAATRGALGRGPGSGGAVPPQRSENFRRWDGIMRMPAPPQPGA